MPHACQGSVLRPRDPRRVPRAPDHLGTPVGVIRPPASRRSHLKPAHGPTVGKSWAVVAATLRKVKKVLTWQTASHQASSDQELLPGRVTAREMSTRRAQRSQPVCSFTKRGPCLTRS